MRGKNCVCRVFCVIVAFLCVFSSLTIISFAEDEIEYTGDVIFYDADVLDEIKGWGHDTATQRVVDDRTGVSAIRLTPTTDTNDPYFKFNIGEKLKAEEYPFVSVIVKKRSQQLGIKLYFKTSDAEKMTEKLAKPARYNPNDKWQIITVDLSDLSTWTGDIEVVRVDYFDGCVVGESDYCDIAGIAIGKTENAVLDAASGFFAEKLGAVARISGFMDLDVGYFSSAYQTSVAIKNGNLIYEAIGAPRDQAFDPQAMWKVEEYFQYKDKTPISADEFGYLVIKQRSTVEYDPKQLFEIFYQTGDRYNAQGGYSARSTYTPKGDWEAIVFNFSNSPEWTGTVHSLRIDWANSFAPETVGYMEISDFVFFADAKSATRYADIINNIVVIRVEREEEKTEEETWADMEDGTLDVGIFTEEIEETHEETLPEFIETTEETEEDVTEVADAESVTEEESTENESEKREESDASEEPVNPDMPMEPGNNEKKEGSQAPFVIACIMLALLSIASIATVLVIRAKNKTDE